MECSVVPFRTWHYDWLDGEPAEGRHFPAGADVLAQLEGQNSWTGVVDGKPIVCAGTIEQWPGRHQAWAYVSKGVLRHMPWITKAVLDNLALVKGRVEFTVRADFRAGQRWAKTLGFEVETPLLRQYGPLGEDHVGFARFN